MEVQTMSPFNWTRRKQKQSIGTNEYAPHATELSTEEDVAPQDPIVEQFVEMETVEGFVLHQEESVDRCQFKFLILAWEP